MTPRPNPPRATSIVWLRKTHGWIGLWGATLGLLFGISGIWLNHRAVLPLKPAIDRQTTQLALPAPPPADAKAMTLWLQQALHGVGAPTLVKVEMAGPAPWVDVAASGAAVAIQPEHWTVFFNTPNVQIQADHWVGNRTVTVRRTQDGVVATLMNLHKGVGMSVPWILLVDSLAGSLILLSLSGLALWMLTRRRRTLGIAVLGMAFVVTAGLALARL